MEKKLRGHPSLRKEGMEKKKAARLLLIGSASEQQTPRVFLVLLLLLIFSGGACGWLRAARQATPARLRRSRLPACPSPSSALPRRASRPRSPWPRPGCGRGSRCRRARSPPRADRKSTRLNSSHLVISYAVFCLKKKKQN